MICDLLIDLLTVICYMIICYVHGCLVWGLTRYVCAMYVMYDKDWKVNMIWTRRSTEIWDGNPLRHLDRKIPWSYGLEWRCVVMAWKGVCAIMA